jgi:sugar lactone lactonase YvrE
VADNLDIRMITPAGIVSTFAGSAGNPGSADGIGTNAQFLSVSGVAVDREGNVYAGDSGNNEIRQITSAGIVSTLAGSTVSAGRTDGVGSQALFNGPSDVVVDSEGNIYVADTQNDTIRLMTSAGRVSTFAGLAGTNGIADGIGSNARFSNPNGIAVDTYGSLFVTDSDNGTIREITRAGVVTTLAGLAGRFGHADGLGTNAQFLHPQGAVVDTNGNVYVGDGLTIRKITPAGLVSTIAGNSDNRGHSDGSGTNAIFGDIRGIALDIKGYLYVTDVYATGVLGQIQTFSGVRMIVLTGTNWLVSTIAGGSGGSADGTGSNALFNSPGGIKVDASGNVYVADSGNSVIRMITYVGTNWMVSTIAGLAGMSGSADGAGNAARFSDPQGIAVADAGTFYVADTGNDTIRKGVFTAYSGANPVAYAQPSMSAQLVVTTLPPEVNGQWRFPWEIAWRDSGQVASNLVAGNYPIQFRNLPGYLIISTNYVVSVTKGVTTFVTNLYYPTFNLLGTTNTGALVVNIGPSVPRGAGWRFLGETAWRVPGATAGNLLPDTYAIEFAPVSGYSKPASQAVLVPR